MAKFLSLTIVFEGQNLNYGEGVGNIGSLKKLSMKGKSYSYISRQALRYDMVRIMNESLGMELTPIGKDKKVVQFEKDAKIDQFPEIDLFGYMKTGENSKNKSQEIRKGVVRLSDAISLESFNNDLEFGNNMGLAQRKENTPNGLFQIETHKSLYSYTVTFDLDKIGVDKNDDISLDTTEKGKRVNILLEAIKLLHRDIKGKRENLSPQFIIGGIYTIGNPFFYNKVEVVYTKDKCDLNTKKMNETLNMTALGEKVGDSTRIGVSTGVFSNIDQLNKETVSIEQFFQTIEGEVSTYYGG